MDLTDELLAIHLGLPTSSTSPGGELLGVKVPGWWSGRYLRPWGYTLTTRRAKVASTRGAVLYGPDQGVEADGVILWASQEDPGEALEVYRLILWAADDSRVLTMSGSATVDPTAPRMIGDQSEFQAVVEELPLTTMEVELLEGWTPWAP